ncbi:MAG: FHA domain-containing protein [Woeseiaceae bacterium]
MAYITQFSNSAPVIKIHIDQLVMTIGQDYEMDICIPEDSILDNHACIESIEESGKYSFTIKSEVTQEKLALNGVQIKQAVLSDGDWLTIGDVEFQFTDDGVNAIKPMSLDTKSMAVIDNVIPLETVKPAVKLQAETTIEKITELTPATDALTLIKELKKEVESFTQSVDTLSTNLGSNRLSRRLTLV